MKITASNTQAIQQKIGTITDLPLNNKRSAKILVLLKD